METKSAGSQVKDDYEVPIVVLNDREAIKKRLDDKYYRIVYIETENAVVTVNEKEFLIEGAYIICLNEKDRCNFNVQTVEQVMLLSFCPWVINEKFDFITCQTEEGLSTTEKQDLFYFQFFKKDHKTEKKLLPLNTTNRERIKQKMSALSMQLEQKETSFWPCRSRAFLLEILFSLIDPVNEENGSHVCCQETNYSLLTVQAVKFVQIHYQEKITLNQLCKQLHTNRTTLLKAVKEDTGLTFNKYLVSLRIKMAATLLKDTWLSISEICERTGFDSISYFSKAFKKEMACTPTQYRKNYQ